MAEYNADGKDVLADLDSFPSGPIDGNMLQRKLAWACELVREASRENRCLKEEVE